MELAAGLGYLGHEIGRHSARGANNSFRRLHYAGRIAREVGNYAADATVWGLSSRAAALVPGLGVEVYNLGARGYNRIGRGPQLPIANRARWGINGNIWSRVLPTWHQPEFPPAPPDPNIFDPLQRHKDLPTRTPQGWGGWNTWMSEQMLDVASDISHEIREETNDGLRMAAYSTNSTYSPFMSKIFRAIPHRSRVTALARDLQDIPTPEEWRTYRTALNIYGGAQHREEAKEYAAAHGLDTKKWHTIEDSYSHPTDPFLQHIYNNANTGQSVTDLTMYRAIRGHITLQNHIAQGWVNNPGGYEPLNAEMYRAALAAIDNPAKALKDADNLEKLQRQMIDHVFSVVGMNLTNILQRNFEAQEIYHVRKLLVHCLYKDLWEYAKYGYAIGNTSHTSIWKEVYDKAFGKFAGLLIETDPIHSRKQVTPIVQ